MEGMTGNKSPTEKSSFKSGNANGNEQNKVQERDSSPGDEYYGGYKSSCDGVSDDQKWGQNQNPVRSDALPAKSLRSVGPT